MRKPDQVLQREDIVDKILEGIHFGYFLTGSITWRDENKDEKLAKKKKIENEILLLLKVYKHSADNVINLDINVYCDETSLAYQLNIHEKFDTYTHKSTTLYLAK